MEYIHHPVDQFRDVLADRFKDKARALFDHMARVSGVDTALNRQSAGELRVLRDAQDRSTTTLAGLYGLLLLAVIGGLAVASALPRGQHTWYADAGVAAALVIAIVASLLLLPRIVARHGSLKALHAQIQTKSAEAERQLAPLRHLLTGNIFPALMSQTMPVIQFDRRMSQGFLENLHTHFGWTDVFNTDRSIQFVHCARLRGNPVLIVRSVRHWIAPMRYDGSLRIDWTESDRTPNGEVRTISRTETLSASIYRPYPYFCDETHILFFSQAAPDLSFSRASPSDLGAQFSRLLDGTKGATRMANRKFDELFAASDIDHEVQFRLLFTPLAQEEMVKILKDQTAGFGPEFSFHKDRMVCRIWSKALEKVDLRGVFSGSATADLDAWRRSFVDQQYALFRAIYAALAPLLAIPLFQQLAPRWNSEAERARPEPCFWELEAIANEIGEKRFRHSASETRNLLKVRTTFSHANMQDATVTAHGFRSEARTAHERVRGGDGQWHDVPVQWKEYFPVANMSALRVGDRGAAVGASASGVSGSFKDMVYASPR
jgi:hypothetical protein